MRDSDLDRPGQDLDAEILKRALHAVNNLVLITDPHLPDDPIVWVNDFFCEFTGYTREEVIGRNCRFLQAHDRDQPGLQVVRDAVAAGRYARVLLRNYRKDGTPFWNDLHLSPVRGDDGAARYFVGLINDVTELEEALRTVTAREREIDETAENERERFGMDLHDGLGQTLAGLRLLATVHRDRLAAEGAAGAAEADRLVRLGEQAALEARLMARGMNPVDAAPEGLADVITAFTDALNLTLAGTGLQIAADVAPVPFPDRRQALHLYRIAQEAVNNAVKHGGAGTITVRLAQAGRTATLEVTSHGGSPVTDSSSTRAAAGDPRDPERRGMGHHGMRYRADLIGASYEAGPSAEGGVSIRVVLPLDAERQAQHVRTAER